MHSRLGVALQGIGVCAAIDVLGNAMGLHSLADAGLFAYLFALPVFSVALGVLLVRYDAQESD